MIPENNVDPTTEIGYNTSNDSNVADTEQYLHIVKLDEQKPIHDVECKHETLIPDPQDKIGNAIYHGCSNPKCGRGWYIRQK